MYLKRGIRQGDPISGYLFDLVVEPLANQMRNSQRLRGIKLKDNQEIRVSQYADDLILFSQPHNDSLVGAIQDLEDFSAVSGLRMNRSKTKCLPVGRIDEALKINSQGVAFTDELKILGIKFSGTNNGITEKNLEEKIPILEKEIAQWKRRNLSLLGKVTVIKSLLLSKLVHIFLALPNPPKPIVKRIETLFYKFLWNDRSDLVKRGKVIQHYGYDGLQMVDVKSFIKSMKLSWIKRLYWSKHDWAGIIKADLPATENWIAYGSKKLEVMTANMRNVFWKDVFSAWAEFVKIHKPDCTQILSDTLWFSDHTKYTKTIVKNWDTKGLRFIADLIDPTTGKLHAREEINEKYGISMNFLSYESLIRSLPGEIRCEGNQKRPIYPIQPYKIGLLNSNTQVARVAYKDYVSSQRASYKPAQDSWQRKWTRDIGVAHEGTMFDIRAATKNTYLQSFHFRGIARIITTNRFLHVIGRSDNGLCTFCGATIETLCHVFWDCPTVQCFIKKLQSERRESLDTTLQFDRDTWFFPRLEVSNTIAILIVTLAKFAIYRARNKENKPSIQHFLNILRLEAEKELGSARLRNKVDEFHNKWGRTSIILRL